MALSEVVFSTSEPLSVNSGTVRLSHFDRYSQIIVSFEKENPRAGS